ncbi:precorrin-2 C(20)-methyltransferase [Marinomonas sp. S3726]|uniref:precorrin-2 C(20)-methyltransferase n=1 Tax=Marinomonas sp. S3726 TaxID=579484 RepID=UPI0005F9CB9B|nr:precorrin-2 C(20)-methyltransferase [Marinomonas sp. S3726]
MPSVFTSASIQNSRTDLVKGRFIGVGVGPGDPELITLKALRLIQAAPVVCYLANDKGQSQALTIASEAFGSCSREQVHIGIQMPMSIDRGLANQAYDEAAISIKAQLKMGLDVVFLCEGDPLFFGSFAYLLDRLNTEFECLSVPGISSVHAASSALVHPLTMLKESFTIVSGRHTQGQLESALTQNDTVVIMKAGRARSKILAALEQTKRVKEAQYLEYIGRNNQKIVTDITNLKDESGPYFSLFLVTRSDEKRHKDSYS